MIKKLHLKSLLLLVAMLFGASSVWADEVTDVLNQAFTGVTGTGYTDFSGKKGASDAVYAGQCAGSNQSIQLRSNSSNSGVISTTSGGKLKSIAVKWHENNLEGRSLNVYGSNTPYEKAANLFNEAQQGTLIGTITAFTTTALVVSGDYKYIGFRSASGAIYLTEVNITWETSDTPTPSISADNVPIDYDATSGSFDFTINNEVTGGTVEPSENVDWISNAAVSGNSVTFTTTANTGYSRSGIITLTYTYGDNKTVTKDVTITQAADPNAPGTENNPYTVAQARAAIDAGTGTQGVYATGIVSAIPTAYSSDYNNITFNIVDNTGEQTFLQAYRCQGDEAANVEVGDIVVVYGNLTKYNTTYEFGQGCTLVSLTKGVAPVITADNVNIAYNATEGSIPYTLNNSVEGGVVTSNTVAEWLILGTVGEETVPFTCSANTATEARTATVTLTYTYGDNQTVTKDVTVTQAGAPTTASLPFEFDGGKDDIDGTDGLTQEGLGIDYKSSPKLKFDGTGDWLFLNFNERPGKLTFDIKGNDFSGGTFKVQTSEDGVTYTDLKTYTEISTTTQNEEFKNLGENVRYIKWIYTTKASGNVALGNIALAKYKEPQSYTLTVSELENVSLYVFDAAAPNDPLIADGGIGTAQVVEETRVMISPDPVEGYTLESLLVDGVDHKDDLGDDGSYTFTMPNKDITITATVSEIIPVETNTYTLATSITSGKHYVIASGTEDDVKVMGAQRDNNRAAVDGTVSGTTLSVTSDAGATEFVIYGPDADGYYAIYDDAANGYLYAASSSSNHLKSQTKINANGKWSISIDNSGVASIVAQGTNSRNVMQYNSGSALFSCYAITSPQSPVYLYEKDGEAAPTETVYVSDAKYATYCSENALDFDGTGLTAYIAKLDDTTVSFEKVTSVPAYTGVLLKADAAGDFTVNVATTVDDVTGNAFIGVTEETSEEAGIFVLMNTTEYGVGFYKAENAFTVGAHTAYIPALPSASRNFIAIDEATAIKSIETAKQSSEIYNLAGQRVKSAQKGLYIIDGKKVVIK